MKLHKTKIPNGYEIDKENSTFETFKDLIEQAKELI